MTTTVIEDKNAVLRLPEFRALLGSRLAGALGRSMLVTVIGYQVFILTRDPLALGWLGLAEAIPALGLALFGGHFADRHDRRRIVLITGIASVICMLLLMALSINTENLTLLAILGVVFIAGIASGFSSPAMSAFDEASVCSCAITSTSDCGAALPAMTTDPSGSTRTTSNEGTTVDSAAAGVAGSLGCAAGGAVSAFWSAGAAGWGTAATSAAGGAGGNRYGSSAPET